MIGELSAVLAVTLGGMVHTQAKVAYGGARATRLALLAFGITLSGLILGMASWFIGGIFSVLTFQLARKHAMEKALEDDEG